MSYEVPFFVNYIKSPKFQIELQLFVLKAYSFPETPRQPFKILQEVNLISWPSFCCLINARKEKLTKD